MKIMLMVMVLAGGLAVAQTDAEKAKLHELAHKHEQEINKPEYRSKILCGYVSNLKDLKRQQDYQREVEKEGGVADLEVKRNLAQQVVFLRGMLNKEKAEYKTVAGKAWSERLCK